MKKLFVIFTAVALVWAFAAPASAVDWNFYGSARMATYYTSTDGGDTKANDNSELTWAGQNNSRIGANVKGEDVRGRFELGFTGKDGKDWDIGGGDGIQVRARRLQGDWNFGAGTLSVGKGYTSINQFVSGQVGRGDGGLLGQGFMYGSRPYFIGLSFGGFGIQLIDPTTNFVAGLGGADAVTTTGTVGGVPDVLIETTAATSDNGRIKEVFPKVEAHWGMAFDTFSFNVRGGMQYFSIDDVASASKPGKSNDIDVTSWALGGDGNFNFGPVRLGFGIIYAQNGGNAGWTAGSGTWDGDDDMDDWDTLQGGVVVNFKMSDMVSFEGGIGVANQDPDGSGFSDSTPWEMYVNSVIALAPGVYIIPEFSYRDLDDDNLTGNDAGTDFYLGAKWQIDF